MRRLLLLVGVAAVAYWYATRKQDGPRRPGRAAGLKGSGGSRRAAGAGRAPAFDPAHPDPDHPDWDKVDLASDQSFPASDPPGYR